MASTLYNSTSKSSSSHINHTSPRSIPRVHLSPKIKPKNISDQPTNQRAFITPVCSNIVPTSAAAIVSIAKPNTAPITKLTTPITKTTTTSTAKTTTVPTTTSIAKTTTAPTTASIAKITTAPTPTPTTVPTTVSTPTPTTAPITTPIAISNTKSKQSQLAYVSPSRYKSNNFLYNKEKFRLDATINPITGRTIKPGSLTYKKLVHLYGDPY